MGSTVGRLLLCLPPALAVGLFFLEDSSAGIEPDSGVQTASASASPDGVVTAIHPGHGGFPEGPKYVGAAGCAAANCHGGNGIHGPVGSEHSVWIQKDPHANAYDILLNEDSKNIIKLLKGSDTYRNMLGNREAHQTKLCLDCHSVAPQESQLAHGHKFSLRDGVSCEGCHGPAEKWLDPHKNPAWQSYTKEQKASLGFYDTDTLSSRARKCAECHIGSKDKEVNHDLMAAGHPRLTFEMSAYYDNLTPHWNHNEDRRDHAVNSPHQAAEHVQSCFDAKLWAIGQLATAEKTVELLKARAENPHKPWPEFTEYGCYACHHNLQSSNWRQKRTFGKGLDDKEKSGFAVRPGGYPWATWQMPVLAEFSPKFLPDLANPFLDNNQTYLKLQAEMARPIPDRTKVAELAEQLRMQLHNAGNTLDSVSFSESEIASLLHAFSGEDGKKLTARNWDAAAQVYLATVALYQGLVDVQGRITMDGIHQPVLDSDKMMYDHFRAIRDVLKFPTKDEATGKPAIYNSPKSFEETQEKPQAKEEEKPEAKDDEKAKPEVKESKAPNPVEEINRQLDGINQAVKP